MATPETKTVPAAPGLPGMPAGGASAGAVAAGAGAGDGARLARQPLAIPPKLPFGGNVGRKARADGLKPGSAEAVAADRERDAQRKRDERAQKRASTPPPLLPELAPPPVSSSPDTAGPSLDALGAVPLDPVVAWTPDDFRQCAVELVELAEAWRVDAHTKHAVVGKLPRPVVEEIARGAAFPSASKKSLSTASPATLAKMFNALHVPVALKPIISTAPALAYLIVRDLQCHARIEKLIAENKVIEAPKTPEAPKNENLQK